MAKHYIWRILTQSHIEMHDFCFCPFLSWCIIKGEKCNDGLERLDKLSMQNNILYKISKQKHKTMKDSFKQQFRYRNSIWNFKIWGENWLALCHYIIYHISWHYVIKLDDFFLLFYQCAHTDVKLRMLQFWNLRNFHWTRIKDRAQSDNLKP